MNQPEEIKMLPCPFCGELPHYQPWCQGHAPEYAWPHQILHSCKVTNSQTCVRTTPDTKEVVFAAWNTRTPNEVTKEFRNGNWIDKWGCCKVCNGEIPYGHTNDCDIYKLEMENKQLLEDKAMLEWACKHIMAFSDHALEALRTRQNVRTAISNAMKKD